MTLDDDHERRRDLRTYSQYQHEPEFRAEVEQITGADCPHVRVGHRHHRGCSDRGVLPRTARLAVAVATARRVRGHRAGVTAGLDLRRQDQGGWSVSTGQGQGPPGALSKGTSRAFGASRRAYATGSLVIGSRMNTSTARSGSRWLSLMNAMTLRSSVRSTSATSSSRITS